MAYVSNSNRVSKKTLVLDPDRTIAVMLAHADPSARAGFNLRVDPALTLVTDACATPAGRARRAAETIGRPQR